ncbi:TPA: hypothetical protein HA231_05505 [Candidatus Woesearchaeota archaeon]|nr:hypothetical protein [Candidatus Woesearchaeota archaeon]
MALFQFDTAILLEKKWGVFVQPGFSTSNPMNASIVGCAEATGFVPVILLEAANNTGIRLDSSNSNCIVVGGDSDTGFLMAGDRLKYAILQGGEK